MSEPVQPVLRMVGDQGVVCEGDFCLLPTPTQDAAPAEPTVEPVAEPARSAS